MLVMKQLRIGSATYDTVGEASVTQVQTSGTKIATVTIDGTATDLYAPEGGGGSTVTVTPILTSGTQTATISVDGTTSTLYAPTPPTVPSASSTTPSMDGTAAVGTATTYARADHVHPTDTSRQATLVSGTNIKTINGNSLLGSGNLSIRQLPSVTSADNGKVLMVVNGNWQATSLPLASNVAFGVVKTDGTSIIATDGVISTASSAAYEVTITLTNPHNPSEFNECSVTQQESADFFPEVQEQLGTITSPTGSATFMVSMPYLSINYKGMSVALGTATCTGGVNLTAASGSQEVYAVTGDGTIVSDGVDYDY